MKLKALFTFFILATATLWGVAQEMVLDSTYYDVGVVGAEDFEDVRRNYYRAYDEDNRPLVIETQQNDGNGEWENWRRRDYTYSDQGDPTTILISVWRPNLEEWAAFKERTFTYDQMGNVLSKRTRMALQPGGELINTRRWEYTYEEEDLQTGLLFQRWEDDAWSNDSRQLWSYNADELPTGQLRQRWDGSAWQDTRRRMWEYEDGIVNMVTEQSFDSESGEWVNERRKGYQNSGSVLWNQSVEQVWDDETQGWQNVRRELYAYGQAGGVETATVQFWEGESWLNTAQTEYQLEDNALNILSDQWNEGSGDWEAYARYQLRFNEAGLKIVEQGWQYWSEQMSTWINDIDSDRWRYFWSEIMVSTNEPTPDADCLLPNPYRSGQGIRCADLPQSGSFTLELFNEIGQLVHTQQIGGGSDFAIHASLPQGWYLCRLRQGAEVLHVQPLVFIP